MKDSRQFYIAATGMTTPIGYDSAMSHAVWRAGHSAYALSGIGNRYGEPVTIASVPEQALDELDTQISDGPEFSALRDRMTRMAIIAAREVCEKLPRKSAVPLLMAVDQQDSANTYAGISQDLEMNCSPWMQKSLSRAFDFGRASGFHALEFAFNYLFDAQEYEYLMLGGVDSYVDERKLANLGNEDRLLSPGSQEGFVPGEAAAFVLLTRNAQLAHALSGQLVAVSLPGIDAEPGHLYSERPYLGEGLHQAVTKALVHAEPSQGISRIYSSMNGEHHWAKELGVAQLRHRHAFSDNCAVFHPADCWGDLGAATAPALMSLAFMDLADCDPGSTCLVYSSSDDAPRGAVVMEKQTLGEVQA